MSHHHGSCHCGAVQFDVELELENLMTCNCSICGRTGAIMAFVPASKVSRTAADDAEIDYQFGPKRIHHSFCRTCGVRTMGTGPGHDGQPWHMVNVRCLDGVDVHALTITQQYDGRAR